MSQINANSHIYKMQVFSQMNFVQFIEDILFIISNHPIANIITSIIFYLILILDSILLVIEHDETTRDRNFCGYDILYYITTLTVEHPTSDEAEVSSITSLIILISYIVILGVVILLQINDFPFLRSLFCFLCYYALPITFPTLFNCFLNAYKNAKSYILSLSIMFVHQIFFVLLTAFIIIMNLFSPIFLNHPFCLARPQQSSLFFIYIIIFTLTIMSVEKWVIYLRLILAVLILFYCLIRPPYFSLLENILALLFEANEIVCTLIYLLVQTRDKRILYFIIAFPSLIVFVILLILVIYPFIICKIFKKQEIFSLFINRKHNLCKEAIESLNINELTNEEIRLLIVISLHLHCSNTIDLIMLFNQRIHYIHEAIFVWIANSRLNSYRGILPKRMMRVSNNFESKINEGNEKFWINVLFSNIYDLPEIAGQIGRNQYRLLKYNSFLNRKFPTLMISSEIFQYNKKPKWFSFIYYVSLFDFFFLFAFCALFISHVFFLSSGNQTNDYMTKLFVVRDYSTNYLLLLTDIWNVSTNEELQFVKKSNLKESYFNISNISVKSLLNSKNNHKILNLKFESSLLKSGNQNEMTDNLTKHWNAMMDNFSLFTSFMSPYEFEPLDDLIKSFYAFAPKFETFLISYVLIPDFLQAALFFPYKEFNELNNQLDNLFLRIHEIFDKITSKQIRIANIYFYISVILISSILIISIVCYVIYTRYKLIQFFESFRTANKSTIAEKCHGQYVKTARNSRFNFIKALPATTCYLFLLFLSVSILIGILFLNKHSTDYNSEQILLVSDCFSEIERTYIWLVASITDYMFIEYNNSLRDDFQKSLMKSDKIGDSIRRKYFLINFKDIINDEMMESIGKTLISFSMPSMKKWKELFYESITKNERRTKFFSYLSHYTYARFFMFVVCNLIIYLLLAYLLLEIEPYYKWGKQEFENKAQEAGILSKFELQKVKDVDFPLNIVLVNESEKVLFATNAAKYRHSVHVGKRLQACVELDHEIKKLTEEKTQNYIEVKSNENNSIYIIPSYDFSTKSIKFENALIFCRKEVSTVFSSELYRKLFYTIYPSYIEIDSEFPMTIDTTLKQQYLIIVVKIDGFNQWADSSEVDDVSNYRQTLSLRISELCKEDGTFCRIRETSDTIFIGMKHEQKATARWDLLKTSAFFANSLMEMINSMNMDYEITNTKVSIVMFKTNEPKTVLGNHRMQLTDFKSDTIFRSEERASKGIAGSVIYTTQMKETNVTNASKIESCFTANGDVFDIWLIV